ncbi:hypothetical protein NADFUDRAFT_42291 [Nadsonia fulvescens var. elongata DSM 6958]|uniref:Uncharacterized protein n=1 Tax=Nadsonia fulvescens var. elongata DSM 6958 TaxID=857566 RepID=A0A1E3PHV4_9ASCO|nr:hypothetical protein NADFUDRAFT_42291 [Nadsonia fulvescens var. elongata DSM 6958]
MNILELPVEIICQIMGYLGSKPNGDNSRRLCEYNSGIMPHGSLKRKTLREQSNLISLLLTNSKLYEIGLSVYYSTLLRPIVFSPFQSKIAPSAYLEQYTKQHGMLNDYHFLSPTHCFDVFQQYPKLISSVKSIAISDYVGNILEAVPSSRSPDGLSWMNRFIASLTNRLFQFSSLKDIYLEIGYQGESTLIVDLLIYQIFPASLDSLSIIIKPGLLGHDALHMLNRRCQPLLDSDFEFPATSIVERPGLKYLKISVLDKYLLSCSCSLKANYTKLREIDASLCYSSLEGLTDFLSLLRCLVFKQGHRSLKQLVLENISPYFIFVPEKFFKYFQSPVWQCKPLSESLSKLVQISNSLNERLPKLVMLSLNTFSTPEKFYLSSPNQYYYSSSRRQTELSHVKLSDLAPLVHECPHNDNYWIYYYLVIQAKNGWDTEQSMISFQNAIILDSMVSVALNLATSHHNDEKDKSLTLSALSHQTISGYKIQLRYLFESTDWTDICRRFNLISN